MHVFGQLQQIREKGGRTATESACKCRSSLSQKQQLKAQIIYHHLPSFQENILNRSTQIRVQPHSAFLWHFPNPPCLHIHLRARPFRHPAARACHNTWERESRRKQMLMEVRIFLESRHWSKVGWCASFTKGERPTRCCGAHCGSV